MEVNIQKAKTHLSSLLRRAAAGEEITIARAGVPVARLIAFVAKSTEHPMGMDRETLVISDDFDVPLPSGVMTAFLGEPVRRKRPRRVRELIGTAGRAASK